VATTGGTRSKSGLDGLFAGCRRPRDRLSRGDGQLLGAVRIGDRLWASQIIDFAVVTIRRQDFGGDVTDITRECSMVETPLPSIKALLFRGNAGTISPKCDATKCCFSNASTPLEMAVPATRLIQVSLTRMRPPTRPLEKASRCERSCRSLRVPTDAAKINNSRAA
jgi:hypothetical protein